MAEHLAGASLATSLVQRARVLEVQQLEAYTEELPLLSASLHLSL